MRSVSQFWSLFWRTAVVFLLMAIVVAVPMRLLGVDVQGYAINTSPTFIKLKPSIWYVSMALTLFGGELIFGVNLVGLIAGKSLNLSRGSWKRYVLGLALLLVVLSILNVVVAFIASIDAWVAYKLYVATSILLIGIFVLAARVSPRHDDLWFKGARLELNRAWQGDH